MFAAVGALSHQHERAFSASLIYMGLGLAAAAAMAAIGVDGLHPLENARLLEWVSEIAVVIALFATGLRLDRVVALRTWAPVWRLLAIAMPLTIGAVTLFGVHAMGLSLGAAVVLGAILAPTDPVLAGDIGVGPPGEEDEGEPRFALAGEAGLNDGLAFPFVLLGLFVLSDEDDWGVEWLNAHVAFTSPAGLTPFPGLQGPYVRDRVTGGYEYLLLGSTGEFGGSSPLNSPAYMISAVHSWRMLLAHCTSFA